MQFIKRLSFKSAAMSRKINYPSADRNKSFILQVLKEQFDAHPKANVLEIASGTGQHTSYFAANFPNYTFQPSEYDSSMMESIREYAMETQTKNVLEPVRIDVTKPFFNDDRFFDYIFIVNMFHITPFECTVGFFENGSKVLKTGGKIISYGPYALNGVLEPQSNVTFDRNLRSQNPEWGVRDINDLMEIAGKYGIQLINTYEMPSNNKCLVWQKII